MLNIGVFVNSFGKPLNEGLKLAKEFGCQSFQIYVTRGDMLASNMDKQARSDFVKQFQDQGLTLSATCGDFGLNFGNVEAFAEKEALLRSAILQTADFSVDIMTTHIGAVGDDLDGAARDTMVGNLKRLGDFATDHGVTLATETGLESGPSLRSILADSDTEGIGVNLDPGNLVMRRFDHMQAVRELAPYIVHTHAKDGIPDGGDGKPREVPLGDGNVDFPAYVALLKEVGFDGAYTIERECGDSPVEDIRKAVEFLKTL